jgi:Putative adhesin
MRYVFTLPLTLAALAASPLSHAWGDKHFSRTVAAQAQGVVDVSNVRGLVDVSGWDRNEVSIEADLSDDVSRVDVSSDGGHTGVKVVLEGGAFRHGEARLHIKIPKNSELDVSAVTADVSIAGVLGLQHVTAVSGNIAAELAGSDVELKTVSGDLKLKGRGQPGRLRVTTVSGDVHVEHGGGDLEFSTVSGTLAGTVDTLHSLRARSTSGDMRFEGKLARGAEVEATTVNGDVTLRTPAEGGFVYEVSSFSGDISDCFDAKAERTSQYGPGKRLEGTRGEGAGHVRLKTMSGDVELCDRS